MGWIEKVKSIIEKLRKSGKTEKEIETIVQQESEKATVTREFEQAMSTLADGVRKMGESAANVRDVFDTFAKAAKEIDVYDSRKNTNNWRRMHGLPMRRKVNRRKKRERGKRADNHPKNADVS